MWPFGFGIGNKYPYTDFHELNTDFLIQKCAEIAQNLKDSIAARLGAETAQAAAEEAQEASEAAQAAAETAQAGAEQAESDTSDYYNNLVTHIGEDVTGWLDDNVTPVGSAVVVDSSLSISGAAADAKVTGDRTAALMNDLIDITDIKCYHQFSQSEAVQRIEQKIYNADNFALVDVTTADTYIFKLPAAGYFHSTQQISLIFLDDSLTPVKGITTLDTNSDTGGYSCQIDEYYPYIAVAVYRGDSTYLSGIYRRISPFENTSGMFPITFLDSYDVTFINDNIINDCDYKIEYGGTGVLSIATGSQQTLSGWHHIKSIPLKKGTKISSMYNTCGINLRGITANGRISFDTSVINRQYVIEDDIFASISYQEGAKSLSKLPTLGNNLPHYTNGSFVNGEEFIKFITITPPEKNYGNKWAGKDWYAYGTSITDIGTKEQYNSTGNIGDGNNGDRGTYPLMIDSLSGMIRHNGAIGSGGIVPSQPHGGNVKDNILSCPADADLVTLEIGPNDPYASNLGEIGDTGDSTLLGNLYQCFTYLTNNVNGKIVLLLVQNNIYNNGAKYTAVSNNQQQWENACSKMAELAQYFGIPVINATGNAINYGKQATGLTLVDGIHLNYIGGALVGRYIWDQLYNIEPYNMFTEDY